MRDDSPLFTFIGPDRQPLDVSKLTHEELRERAYETVRADVKFHREEAQAEAPDTARLADDRYLLSERYRIFLKRVLLRADGDGTQAHPGERDNARYARLYAVAIDLAARIGRLQGIETEKPVELRLPERYIARIDESGVVSLKKEDWDSHAPPEQEGPPN